MLDGARTSRVGVRTMMSEAQHTCSLLDAAYLDLMQVLLCVAMMLQKVS